MRGFSEGAIARMAALEQVHRGVYAYGAVRGPWFNEWAAMLACGARAFLSHTTSLALYDIRDRPHPDHVAEARRRAARGGGDDRGRAQRSQARMMALVKPSP
jgi:hypothetical protein